MNTTAVINNPFEVLERLQFGRYKKTISCNTEGRLTFFERKRVRPLRKGKR